MEYIKKKDLIKNEIYIVKIDINEYIFKFETELNNCKNIRKTNPDILFKCGNFTNWSNIISLATSEKKHWLNTCIEADKFVTYDEAIKTFIPEYLECTNPKEWILTIRNNNNNLIFDTKNESVHLCGNNWKNIVRNVAMPFKASTKEAYDAQFVVKELKFVLPEKWCIKQNSQIINDWLNVNKQTISIYTNTNGYELVHFPAINGAHLYSNIYNSYTEITFDQFKKYVLKEETVEEKVIESLPQFKVIESIETITKVENNEGNQFFIGDKVINNAGVIANIESFKYSVHNTNILAVMNSGNVIGIDKIEHCIEPKADYEILEYKTEGGISCKTPFLADSHQFYINERCRIYSIKRISDNLIITIGDNVLSKTCGVPNKILSIELINNKIRLYPRNSFYNLEDILKINNK